MICIYIAFHTPKYLNVTTSIIYVPINIFDLAYIVSKLIIWLIIWIVTWIHNDCKNVWLNAITRINFQIQFWNTSAELQLELVKDDNEDIDFEWSIENTHEIFLHIYIWTLGFWFIQSWKDFLCDRILKDVLFNQIQAHFCCFSILSDPRGFQTLNHLDISITPLCLQMNTKQKMSLSNKVDSLWFGIYGIVWSQCLSIKISNVLDSKLFLSIKF